MDHRPLPYQPLQPAQARTLPVRGWQLNVLSWGDADAVSTQRPPLVLLHGWMDVAASWQFVVDALQARRWILAPDWRGFGGSVPQAGAHPDSYWFADYLGDLELLLDALLPADIAAIDLVGHSMGANVAMLYAGIRPARVRRLVNLEGFGLPGHAPEQAPALYARWLDALKTPQRLRDYASREEVAERLRHNNPRLAADKAAWLAGHWARPDDNGRWQLSSDPAHKRPHALAYRPEEVLACWRCITAPVLWMEGAQTDTSHWWGDRYPRALLESRLAQVPHLQRQVLQDCAHMLHHDQPQALARHLEAFLDG